VDLAAAAVVAVVIVVAAAAVVAAVAAEAGGEVAANALPDFSSLATAIGTAWASELVHALQDQERDVVGPWPGTLGEARMRVLRQFRVKFDLLELDRLARLAIVGARRGWLDVAGRDPEA
jgi:hypothetical protein